MLVLSEALSDFPVGAPVRLLGVGPFRGIIMAKIKLTKRPILPIQVFL